MRYTTTMNQEMKRRVTACAAGFSLPRYRELPSVGLYLDQTVQLVNSCFRGFPGVELTPSMVSNYVKKGVISHPVKKKYSREQLASLIYIVLSKNVLSLENIDTLFQMQRAHCTAAEAYDYFCDEVENCLPYIFGTGSTIRGLDLYTLSNTGAYGEHGPTTVGLSGHKSIPLYSNAEAFRFTYDVVYTNHMSAGAYRGYGATQGLFAVESAVNELAAKLHMDPFKIREMNIVHEGDVMPAYYGAVNTSCTLDRCLAKVHEMINWDEKYPRRDMGNGKIRAVGMGMAMQGSGISGMDVGSATLKINDEGFYTLLIGAADMGTGCDTTLAQIAAEVLECGLDNITVFGADTDTSPYDSGSYASSTTYITGKAVEKCALKLRSEICKLGAQLLDCSENDVEFDGKTVFTSADPSKSVSLGDIATASMVGHDIPLEVTETHMSPLSPPPYMVGAAEVEVDTETGEVKLLEFDACVDCGTPINPNLTRVQAEGGILQGIGMTLTENVTYDQRGWPMENSLMQYKIPTRVDVGKVRVEFENSYEPNGPFGAKSIGEVVINTPLPAISDAIYNAIGTRFYELPITPEKIAMAVAEKEGAVG